MNRIIKILILLLICGSIYGQTRRYAHNEYYHAASIGMIPGTTTETKFGANSDIDDASGEELLWEYGGSISLLSSAEPLLIVSADANDDDGDTGARSITIIGLDGDYVTITETVTMNGTSNVETADTFLRVLRMYVETAGTSAENEGAITATAKSAGTVQAYIGPHVSQTEMLLYTVPANKTCYVVGAHFSGRKAAAGSDPKLTIHGHIRLFGSNKPFRTIFNEVMDIGSVSNIDLPQYTQVALPEKTDIQVVVDSDQDNTFVSGRLFLVCYED